MTICKTQEWYTCQAAGSLASIYQEALSTIFYIAISVLNQVWKTLTVNSGLAIRLV